MQFATAAVPVPIDSELYCTEFEEEVVAAASEAVGSIHVDLNSDCQRSECSQMPGGLPLWLDATAEGEVAVAAAVDGNFQANETDHFRQIVHHYSFLLLPLLLIPAE